MKQAILRFLAVTGAWAALATGVAAQSVTIEGVAFEPTIQLGGSTLQLNGVGLRTRVIFKVYAAGLYVPQKSNAAATLLEQKGPRRVAITMLRNVSADDFASALIDGLRNNHTEQQLAAFKGQIDTLQANMKEIGQAKKGDAIHFEFLPEAGTRLVVNGQAKGAAIPGEDFFAAVLRVWLGDKPADADLKKGLLGG
jgi:hypothetical protein